MSRETIHTGAMRALIDAVGGVAALAALVPCSPRSLARWGRVAPEPYRTRLNDLARRRRLPEPYPATK